MRRLKKLARVVVSITGIYYFIVMASGLLVTPQEADIAVVLGNEVLASGKPSARLAARVNCALELYRQKKVKLIMVSGGTGASGFDEAVVMASHLQKSGVPESDIIIDSAGINTMATAVNTAKLMRERHIKSAIIVTQYFHIPRTKLAFYMAGITHFSADYPAYFEFGDVLATLREMVAIPVYLVTKPRFRFEN